MNAESVKARLKNIAVKDGGTMQDKLITYALERSIYRLSVSKYVDRFTLKGGIFLYALFDKQFARATRDIDLFANRIPNNVEKMYKVFQDVFSIDSDDALRFDINSLNVYLKNRQNPHLNIEYRWGMNAVNASDREIWSKK